MLTQVMSMIWTVIETMSIKSYSGLMKLKTFEERFEYLKMNGRVGSDTFGYDRVLNQMLYTNPKWRAKRNDIIIRDNGNDLGMEGYEIGGPIIVHHINPITANDILEDNPCLYDEENLISTSDLTHKAIHYSNADTLPGVPIERSKNDTCPWKK